jgi:hypothetical protein
MRRHISISIIPFPLTYLQKLAVYLNRRKRVRQEGERRERASNCGIYGERGCPNAALDGEAFLKQMS